MPLQTFSAEGVFRASLPTLLCVWGGFPIRKKKTTNKLISPISRHNDTIFEAQPGPAAISPTFVLPCHCYHNLSLDVARRSKEMFLAWHRTSFLLPSWTLRVVIRSAWASHGAHPHQEGEKFSSVFSGRRTQQRPRCSSLLVGGQGGHM